MKKEEEIKFFFFNSYKGELMGGKITNILLGISNIVLGVVLVLFELIKIRNSVSFSKYENEVISMISLAIIAVIILAVIIQIIYAIIKKYEPDLSKSYLLILLVIIYIFYPKIYTAALPMISGISILIAIFRKNFIEAESFASITVTTFQIMIYILIVLVIMSHGYIADRMRIEDNKDLLRFDEEEFSKIEPLDISEPYINLKRNINGFDEKFGYINKEGIEVIPFEYDYATPFYKIKKDGKEYILGAVTTDDITEVILKNQRSIMSYKSKYEIFDYLPRINEFEEILKTEIGSEKVELEIPETTNNFIKKERYKENTITGNVQDTDSRVEVNAGNAAVDSATNTNVSSTKNWTYRYDYNEKYDLLVTESKLGNQTKFEFAEKNDLNNRLNLDVEYLVYDEDYLYVYEGDKIPFYSPSKKMHGYVENTGNRKKIEGRAQVIDVKDSKVLIKNYAKETAYFTDLSGKVVSPMYKDIVIDSINNRYIAKTNNNKWIVLNENLEKAFQDEFDIAKFELLNVGLYVFANLPEEEQIEFNKYKYPKIEYNVVNSEGKSIVSNVNFLYNIYDKYTNSTMTIDEYNEFIEKLKESNIKYAGDEYYRRAYNINNTNTDNEENVEEKNTEVDKSIFEQLF